jgi:predicted SnoaL-like aldol condensation-catalyzing enzyme
LLLDPSSAREGDNMIKTTPEQNKMLVLQAFDTLFNKRDYNAAERYWSLNYIQHSAHIAPGRDGLFNLARSTPPTLKYEPGLIVAESDYVIVHGRFSGTGSDEDEISLAQNLGDLFDLEDEAGLRERAGLHLEAGLVILSVATVLPEVVHERGAVRCEARGLLRPLPGRERQDG